MLSYSIADRGNMTIYEYLYRCIRNDVLGGELRAGERLPSRRSLAENLGISTISVDNAYAQLEAEGYISAVPRKGYFVEEIRNNVSGSASEMVEPKSNREAGRNRYYANLTGGGVDTDDFPFSVWSKLVRELLNDSREELLMRSPGNGIWELRSAIAEHLRDFRGMNVSAEQIIIGAGTDHLYGQIIQLLGTEKIFGLEDPGYGKIGDVYKSYRAKCEYLSIESGEITPRILLAKNIGILHISPSHHYPTGRIMPVGMRNELLRWASEGDRYIIEDDYDSEFRMSGKPIPTMQSMDNSGRVIYMNTFTKTLASTIRIGYMVLPEKLLDNYRKRLHFSSCSVSNFEQYTLARFIERGYFEKHINRMRKKYRDRRDMLLKQIHESPINSLIDIMEQDAGLHFLMRIHTEKSDVELIERAKERGIDLEPLSGSYRNIPPTAEHVFVINYASLMPERMGETVERLYKAIFSE